MIRAAALAAALSACSALPRRPTAAAARAPRGFVQRHGRCLVRDGRRLRLVGSSAFFLQEEAARELLGQGPSRGTMDATFDAAARAGLSVLRVLGFNDGGSDAAVIQPVLGVLAEPGLRGLDRVVAEASRRGVLLVIAVTNYWDAYGGAPQYLRWTGHAPDDHVALYADPRVLAAIAHYASSLVTRRNAFTGVRYADDPTIAGWEVINEPRGNGLADRGETVARFVGTIARALHAAAPRQLVFAGDEGLDAVEQGYDMAYWRGVFAGSALLGAPRHESFQRIASDPAIDVATLHWYPDWWRIAEGHEREAGARWIVEHARLADAYAKPLFFEEFGELERGPNRATPRPLDERRGDFAAWFAATRAAPNGAGFLPWGLTFRRGAPDPTSFDWGAGPLETDPYAREVRAMSDAFDLDASLAGCD